MESTRTDSELLERFSRGHDQWAFKALVDRYAGLVYSAALRQVGPALAEDASQAVFVILAKKAHRIDGRTLAGWLVKAARLTALASQRMESRRGIREQKAAMMKTESISARAGEDAPPWEALAPLLDEALTRLGEKDRSAITLRYLQGKSVREVAAAMSISEAAAGKRATRAVRALREYFGRRGVKISSESIGAVLAINGTASLPAGLAGNLAAAATGSAATAALSATATGLVQGTLSLMIAAKAQAAAAVAIAVFILGGGGVYIASRLSPDAPTPVAAVVADLPAVAEEKRPAAPAPPIPATVPGRETFTRFATPAGNVASFVGRVEGLTDPTTAEVGIVALRGTHWTSTLNYQWERVEPDGTFQIAAGRFPEARRALAIRAPGQSVTFLRAEFESNESARDIVVHMKPTRPITILAKNSAGDAFRSFKVEIFDASAAGTGQLNDDEGRPLRSQRLDAPMSAGGEVNIDVPLEPLALLISGDGIAPAMRTIDPRETDHFEFSVLSATPIDGIITENGKPVADLPVMLNNPAVRLSYMSRKTDAKGYFKLAAGIPGTYVIAVRDKKLQIELIEGQPLHLTIDLATLASPTTVPTTLPSSAMR